MATSDNSPEKESTVVLLNRLKEIASAVMTAAEAGTLEQVFERIAHVAGELVNARYAALGIPDNTGGLKYFKVAGLSSEQIAHIGHLPHGRGLLGAIMEEGTAVRLVRMQEDTRSSGFCERHPTMTSLGGAAQEAELKPAMRDLDRVIEDIRRFILNLRVSSYRKRTMYEAMRDVLARVYIPENVRVEIDAPDIQPLISEMKFEAVCQMAHEAMSNALRHANPSLISISAHVDDDIFRVVIVDDGDGFDLDIGKGEGHTGLGLQNLQRRAQLHGGQLDIVSARGEGTRLTITVPMQTG